MINARSVVVLLILAAGCGAPSPAEKPASMKEPLPQKAQWSGQYSGFEVAAARIIDNEKAWTLLWNEAGQPAPEVDFEHRFAVAVLAGPKPTGGFTVEINEPEAGVITYRIKSPPPGAMVTQAFTQPFAVRVFQKTATMPTLREVQ